MSLANKMSIFEYLRLRTDWEELATQFVGVNQHGTVESLKDFVERGHKKNRFRPGFDKAIDIANKILNGV